MRQRRVRRAKTFEWLVVLQLGGKHRVPRKLGHVCSHDMGREAGATRLLMSRPPSRLPLHLRSTTPWPAAQALCSGSMSLTCRPRQAQRSARCRLPLTTLQSDMSVEQALRVWPQVAAKAPACGSPAVASNYTWLAEFLRSAQVPPSPSNPVARLNPNRITVSKAPAACSCRPPLRYRRAASAGGVAAG